MGEITKQREENGAPGAIRTPGPQIRSLMLYPAELRVHGEALLGVAFRIRNPKYGYPRLHVDLRRIASTAAYWAGSVKSMRINAMPLVYFSATGS
jgi:hypothetical protein